MPVDYKGLRVVTFESRRAAEMAALIERHGGRAVNAPTMREVKNQDPAPVLDFAARLFNGEIDIVLLLTGVGTTMLADTIAAKHPKEKLIEALRRTITIARGPKPVAALRTLGMKPTREVPEPNTWQDLLDTLDAHHPVAGKHVAVQEYGLTNDRLVAALQQRGADVMRVPVYQWALPEDLTALRAAIDGVIGGDVDVGMFTSATQVYHLFQLAAQDGKADALREGFKRVLIASVGPVCTEAIGDHGLTADFEPDAPHMAPLVRETARRSEYLLAKKRVAVAQGVNTNGWRRVDMVWTKSYADVAAGAPGLPGLPGLPGAPTIEDSVFLKACRREVTPCTPVWIMRQAGRYQRAYREIRKGMTLLELCRSPHVAAEVTLMAADRLGVDAAIIFSDILPIVEPLGFQLEYVKGDGPVIRNPVTQRSDVQGARKGAPGCAAELEYVYEALRITRRALRPDIALIGFCGAPFTIASYLIEGGKSKDYAKTKTLMLRDPVTWAMLMEKLVEVLIDYLNRQVDAGADAVQVFDSWAGALSPDHYRQHVMPHVSRLIAGVKAAHGATPLIHFATGNPALLPLMKQAGGDVIGLDWRVDLAQAWATLGDDVAVMGNLDPAVLYCSPAEIREQVQLILDKAAGRPGHIFNLGHGVSPDMPPEHVAELVDAVHELSVRLPSPSLLGRSSAVAERG